ncbi:MAG: hypothetical protein AAB308_04920, partial [Nitrospirota bacterium]
WGCSYESSLGGILQLIPQYRALGALVNFWLQNGKSKYGASDHQECFGTGGEATQRTGGRTTSKPERSGHLYLEDMTRSVPVDADALLARARAVRRAPKGLKVTDQLLDEPNIVGRL